MSLRTSLRTVSGIVAGITPRSDVSMPFTPWEQANGSPGARLEDCEAPGRSRYFDVVVTQAPTDGGAACVTALRFVAGFAVRVVYEAPYGADEERRDRTVAEDVASILTAISDPSAWDSTTNLIDTIDSGGPAQTSQLGDGAVLVSIPFSVEFYEA